MCCQSSIMVGNRQCRRLDSQFTIHFCCGTFDCLSADDGGDCNAPHPRPLSWTERREYSQDWIDAYPRIRRADDDCIRGLERFTRPGSGFRFIRAIKSETFDARLAALMYKILLKCQVAFFRFDNSFYWRIGHRQDSMFNSPRSAKIPSDLTQALTFFQSPRPLEMSAQILVTEIEPTRSTKF